MSDRKPDVDPPRFLDLAAFPDFRGWLSSALSWPELHPEMRVDNRAERWAPQIAHAVGRATRAGFRIAWLRPPTTPDAAEGRRILILADRFEQEVDKGVGKSNYSTGVMLATLHPDLHSPYILLLERILFRENHLRARVKEAVLAEAEDLLESNGGMQGGCDKASQTIVVPALGQSDEIALYSEGKDFGVRKGINRYPFMPSEKQIHRLLSQLWPPVLGKEYDGKKVKEAIDSEAKNPKWATNMASNVCKVLQRVPVGYVLRAKSTPTTFWWEQCSD